MSEADLQFDKAEFGQALTPCAACGQAITGPWWGIGDRRVCEQCKLALDAQVSRPVGWEGYGKAAAFGAGAAALGAAAWAGVAYAMDHEFAILAIGIGWLVAEAMRRGAGRGTRGLQVLAVMFTYLAIVLGSVPATMAALNADDPGSGVVHWALMLAVTTAFALIRPAIEWTGGFSSIFWYVIVGIALLRAWRALQPTRIVFTGPYSR